MIKQTNDYSIFEKYDSNRKINEVNVQKIMKSISAKNLLEFRPILVDENMRVIDGQHRLEAAKRLGVGVYYEVMKKPPSETVILLNTNQKRWNIDDYLNYFEKEGNSEYKEFNRLIEEANVSFSVACLSMGLPNGTARQQLKSGLFTLPPNAESNLKIILKDVQDIKDFIKFRKIGSSAFLESEKFKVAVIRFITKPGVDKQVFLNKLDLKLEWIRPCVNVQSFLDIFVSIYNYKNKNPVSGVIIEDEE